jgi:superfamily II DNA or RNA helicase
MELVQNPKKARIWAQKHGLHADKVRGFLAVFMRLLRQRKAFVMSHAKKFEIANKILDARPNSKCIIFSATVKDAEMFKKRALTLHSQKKKKENAKILEQFNQMDIGVISSPKALNQGVDVKGLSVGIAITCDSSQTTNVQKIGRICRFEEGKQAEMFTLVIKNTIENTWFDNANKNTSYITITEKQLETVLKNEYLSVRPKRGVADLEHRF